MKRGRRQILITAGIILVGLLLILYPFISNYLYEHRQAQVIFDYDEKTQSMDDEVMAAALREAQAYNDQLSQSVIVLTDPFDPDLMKKDVLQSYDHILNVYGDGVMGYIEIPKISVYLPIYHGTEAATLEKGIGHLENTSLPVGGESTHCVVSGHTGLSDKRLFTDLEMLESGDRFYVQVLGEQLAYEVDQILVVEPNETEALRIIEGGDYMTLVTCTPYGVNSHRLLVRGRRVPYVPEEKEQAAQTHTSSQWMRQYILSVFIGAAILLVLMVILQMFRYKNEKP